MERLDLLRRGRAVRLFRRQEMRHEAQRASRFRTPEALESGRESIDSDAEPIHAGIDLQPHVMSRRGAFEQGDLLERMYDDLEIVVSGLLELLCSQDTFEQHDALTHGCRTQRERFA